MLPDVSVAMADRLPDDALLQKAVAAVRQLGTLLDRGQQTRFQLGEFRFDLLGHPMDVAAGRQRTPCGNGRGGHCRSADQNH